MNLERIGEDCTRLIKQADWFPYKTGWLRNHATHGDLVDSTTYCITFDNTIAMAHPTKNGGKGNQPYITYLEEGTTPHDIQFAFGRKKWKDGRYPFGIGGRFDGKFHPGSSKHKGFISEKSVNAIISYICSKYKGELK